MQVIRRSALRRRLARRRTPGRVALQADSRTHSRPSPQVTRGSTSSRERDGFDDDFDENDFDED